MARVLVIDDEPEVRKVVRRVLEAEGHDVRETEDGASALALLAEHAVDLIITDLYMPSITGI